MTRDLSLHHLTATEVTQVELIRIAASLGCRYVCLFVNDPGGSSFPFPYVSDDHIGDIISVLDGEGVQVLATTSFPVLPDADLDGYRAGFARAARLGASVAGLRVLDDDRDRALDTFGAICDMGAEFGLVVAIEPTRFSATESLDSAVQFVRDARHSDARLVLDPLHLTRTGTTAAQLHALPTELIGYAQICDGPASVPDEEQTREWVADRWSPGEGTFDLSTLLDVIPADMPISIEVPMNRLRDQGVAAAERAAQAVAATRRVLGE